MQLSPSSEGTVPPRQGPQPAFVQLATVLRGVQPLTEEKGINDSFRGQLMLADGTIRSAIIKDLDPKQLANELMVAALAHAAGMPIPGANLARAPEGVMPTKHGPSLPDGSRLVFGSIDVQTPPVAQHYQGQDSAVQRQVRERIAEWNGVGDLYGFDSWVANTDRHERNLLFCGDKDVWLIDHGHCFTGPRWAPNDLDAAQEYKNKLRGWLTPVMSAAQKSAAATASADIAARVKDLDLQDIGESNYVVGVLGKSEFAALVSFLSDRNAHVARLAASALDLMV